MSRNRSHCIIIQNSHKAHKEIIDNDNSDNEESHNTIIIDNGKDNIARIFHPSDLITDTSLSHLKKPLHSNTKKEYRSKHSHPLNIHEKAQIIDSFDRSGVTDIYSGIQIINFTSFLFEFKNEEEIQNLELQDLLDVDYEKLEELKEKTSELIDATSMLISEKTKIEEDSQQEEEIVIFFDQKLQEMRINEINLKIFVNNIEKVSGISYNTNGVKVYFKDK